MSDIRLMTQLRALFTRLRGAGAGMRTPASPPIASPYPVAGDDSAARAEYSEARALIKRLGGNIGAAGLLPTSFSIEIGVAPCNHSCLFCPQSVHKPKRAKWLSMDILRKVLSEMPESGIQIGLSSYSETIAAKNLVDSVRLIKEVRPGLPIAMATNGTVFREQVVAELIDAGLDHFSFSFDAATREDYKRLMQIDHFDKAWASLERVVEMRNEKQSDMMITTHIMGFEGKRDDFERFKAYWDDKVDFVQWRTVANWGGENWNLADNLAAAGFVPEHKTPARRYPCFAILQSFQIDHDGIYYPCVAAVADSEPDQKNHAVPELGHASEVTWTEAWQNLSAMRRAHLEGRWDTYECCRTCNVWSLYDDVWERVPRADGGTSYAIPGLPLEEPESARVG